MFLYRLVVLGDFDLINKMKKNNPVISCTFITTGEFFFYFIFRVPRDKWVLSFLRNKATKNVKINVLYMHQWLRRNEKNIKKDPTKKN